MTIAVALVLCVALSFHFELFRVVPGIDVPFRYAFNWAAAHHVEWGTGFVSTYGPYGHLIFTAAEGQLWRERAAFEGILAVGGALAAVVYVRSVPDLGPAARLGCVALLVYAIALQPDEYRSFATFLLILLGALQRRDRVGWWALGVAGGLAGFALLVKFSLGLACVASLFAGSLVAPAPGSRLGRLAVAGGAAAAGLAGGWLPRGWSLGGLVEYLRTGAELAGGYSSAMSLYPGTTWLAHGAAAGFVALLAGWLWMKPAPRLRVRALQLALPLFLVWKHATVRQDPLHVWLVPAFGLFALSVLWVEAWRESGRWASLAVLACAAVLLALVPINPWTRDGALGTLRALVTRPLQLPGVRGLGALWEVASRPAVLEAGAEDALGGLRLPDAMRDRIGDASIDVYPWETSYVVANDLRWRNRPVATSFVSYTPHLDERNARFLRSDRRPQYLLWHDGVRSVDERHVFWDEPRTFRTLLDLYDLAWTGPSVALLEARAEPRWGPPEPLGVTHADWGRWLEVPQTTGVLLADVRIERSLQARAARVLYREAPLFLSLRFRTGEAVRHRFVPDQAGSGLWVSPFAVTAAEFWSLAQGGPARPVAAIRFDRAGGGAPSAKLRIAWTRIAPAHSTDEETPPAPLPAPDPACRGRLEKAWTGSGWRGAAISALGTTDGEPTDRDGGGLWLTDERGRVLPTHVVPTATPGLAQWWAIAWPGAGVREVGFVRRDARGAWVPSCGRARLR